MKGLELSTNAVIFVIVGFIVLLAVFSAPTYITQAGFGTSLESVKLEACVRFKESGCKNPEEIKTMDFDSDKDGDIDDEDDLEDLRQNYFDGMLYSDMCSAC